MDSLASVVSALKTYSEQIVRNVARSDPEKIISNVDRELHAKQSEAMVINLPGMRHSIQTHSAKPEDVFKAFREASSLKDFADRLDKISSNNCGGTADELSRSQDEVNRVRKQLGLSPFPLYKIDDEGDFRKSRMRKMRELREREKSDLDLKNDK